MDKEMGQFPYPLLALDKLLHKQTNQDKLKFMTTKKNQSFQFEKAITELEKLVDKMEGGELPLEDALKTFERGVTLIKDCQQALKTAEQKVQILLEKQGKTELASFSNNE